MRSSQGHGRLAPTTPPARGHITTCPGRSRQRGRSPAAVLRHSPRRAHRAARGAARRRSQRGGPPPRGRHQRLRDPHFRRSGELRRRRLTVQQGRRAGLQRHPEHACPRRDRAGVRRLRLLRPGGARAPRRPCDRRRPDRARLSTRVLRERTRAGTAGQARARHATGDRGPSKRRGRVRGLARRRHSGGSAPRCPRGSWHEEFPPDV
jgi:hypothetical protein